MTLAQHHMPPKLTLDELTYVSQLKLLLYEWKSYTVLFISYIQLIAQPWTFVSVIVLQYINFLEVHAYILILFRSLLISNNPQKRIGLSHKVNLIQRLQLIILLLSVFSNLFSFLNITTMITGVWGCGDLLPTYYIRNAVIPSQTNHQPWKPIDWIFYEYMQSKYYPSNDMTCQTCLPIFER